VGSEHQAIDDKGFADVVKTASASAARTVEGYRLAMMRSKVRIGRVSDVTFSNVDFNGMMIGGMLSHPVFEGCRFQDVAFGPVNARSVTWQGCRLANASIGGKHQAVFQDSRFVDCVFQDCDLKAVFFHDCEFVRCRFEGGSIQNTGFRRCAIDHVEFLPDEMNNVGFAHCEIVASKGQSPKWTGVGYVKSNFTDSAFPSSDPSR